MRTGKPKLVVPPDDPLTLKAAELYRNGASIEELNSEIAELLREINSD